MNDEVKKGDTIVHNLTNQEAIVLDIYNYNDKMVYDVFTEYCEFTTWGAQDCSKLPYPNIDMKQKLFPHKKTGQANAKMTSTNPCDYCANATGDTCPVIACYEFSRWRNDGTAPREVVNKVDDYRYDMW